MQWASDAEAAIQKVPFFVRKKVRRRVEQEALAAGHPQVRLADVKATQKRFLNNQRAEITGYQLDACFGPSGCPRRAVPVDGLLKRLEALLKAADLLSFLNSQVEGALKFHHEFRISLAECPNGCSQPQIKDIGILGAAVPAASEEPCSDCGACVEACPDGAIRMDEVPAPQIVSDLCMACGQCPRVCPTGTLVEGRTGYRVQLGGKLGRHPHLGTELSGLFSENQVVAIVEACIDYYKSHSRKGKRFAELVDQRFLDNLQSQFDD